jgi:predicted ATPase
MIKLVRIKNYKSLGDVTVELDPLTVLIGRTGSGKSNFVEAIRFLRDYLFAFSDAPVNNTYGGWPRVLSANVSAPRTCSFLVHFEVPGSPTPLQQYEYLIAFTQEAAHHNSVSVYEEYLSLGGRMLFHQRAGGWMQRPDTSTPVSLGSVVLGALAGIPEITVAYLVLTRGLGCYSFPDDVLIRPGVNPRPEESGLLDHGENFLQAFNAVINNFQVWDHWKEMRAALRRLDSSVKNVTLEMPSRGRIVVGHQYYGPVLTFDLAQESEGFRRFLAHLLALYQTPSKQALLFEEPEKGIHPGALAILAEEFQTCPDAGRGQILLTTHSPELLNHFPPESLRVVEIGNHVTRIGRVDPDQVEAIREQLLRPGELLTVDPARRETVPVAQ